jgi:hypothetical protein
MEIISQSPSFVDNSVTAVSLVFKCALPQQRLGDKDDVGLLSPSSALLVTLENASGRLLHNLIWTGRKVSPFW